MTKRIVFQVPVLATVVLLASCAGGGSQVKETLGLKAPPPDEFSVVTRAPLSVPPDFTLRPPRPGASGPNEISVRDQARKTVLGTSGGKAPARTSGQESFLSKLGAGQGNPDVRTEIDSETKTLNEDERPVVQRLLSSKDARQTGKTIDPVEEQKRLEAEGKTKAPTEVTIEKRNEDILKAP